MDEFGRLDILVNNAAEQHPRESLLESSREQLERTFRTNIFSYFYMAKAALRHLQPGSAIINTTSVTAYRGSSHLLDYSSLRLSSLRRRLVHHRSDYSPQRRRDNQRVSALRRRNWVKPV